MLNIDYIFIYSTFGERAECVVEGHGLDVEGGEDGLLVGHGGVLAGAGHLGTTVTIQRMLPSTHLGGEDDAHVAQVDVDRPQVLPVAGAAGQHRDLGQVLQRLPLSADVVHLQGCKRLIDKVVQSWRRPILEPSPG